MPRRSSRRLAGYIAIKFLLAASAFGAAEFRAGFVSAGIAKALALEDRTGTRAVIVTVGFPLPLSTADPIAAQAIQLYGLPRANILLHSAGAGEPATGEVVRVIGAALSGLQPAALAYRNATLYIASSGGVCLAVLSAEAAFENCESASGRRVRGPIRSAFRVVDLAQGLQRRGDALPSCTVQAVALGDAVVVLSAPSNALRGGPGRILAASPPVENDPAIGPAIAEVLSRVKWRLRD